MVSITHYWKNRGLEVLARCCVLAFCGAFLAPVHAAGISYKAVAIGEENGWIVLDLLQDYQLSPTMEEALDNGVPLTFETEVILDPEEASFWHSALKKKKIRRQLRFHPLAEEYEVLDADTQVRRRFATRDAALVALGDLKGKKIIPARMLKNGVFYLVKVQTSHDIGALPLPLRPRAYLSPGWHLSSRVYEWRLQP
ncbi:DUF4390 domain-containing protein [Thiolapillus sp.]